MNHFCLLLCSSSSEYNDTPHQQHPNRHGLEFALDFRRGAIVEGAVPVQFFLVQQVSGGETHGKDNAVRYQLGF